MDFREIRIIFAIERGRSRLYDCFAPAPAFLHAPTSAAIGKTVAGLEKSVLTFDFPFAPTVGRTHWTDHIGNGFTPAKRYFLLNISDTLSLPPTTDTMLSAWLFSRNQNLFQSLFCPEPHRPTMALQLRQNGITVAFPLPSVPDNKPCTAAHIRPVHPA